MANVLQHGQLPDNVVLDGDRGKLLGFNRNHIAKILANVDCTKLTLADHLTKFQVGEGGQEVLKARESVGVELRTLGTEAF